MILAYILGLLIATQAAGAPETAPANPVIAAYREFTAARDRGDLGAAEAAAAKALAASEARDGDGGSTAVLALNLAIIRIGQGHPTEAIAPAERALSIVQKGGRGVDLLQARLTLADARLRADPTSDRKAAHAALSEAESRADLDDAAFSSAMALAPAALKARDHDSLIVAWRAVATHAAGAHGDTQLLRGRALTQEALALQYQRKWQEADAVAVQAQRILVKLAPEEADADRLTIGEQYYADALAVRQAILNAAPERRGVDDITEGRRSLPDKPGICVGRLSPDTDLNFPPRALDDGEVGAVVVRANIDADGKVTRVRAVSTAVADDFRRVVEDKAVKWSFKVDLAHSVAGCRIATNDYLLVVAFRIEPDVIVRQD